MTFMNKVVEDTTDDFVDLFATDPTAYDSAFGWLAASGVVPEHVDPRDERVQKIIAEAKRRYANRGTT